MKRNKGEFHLLVKELDEHPNRYEKFFRMTKEEFNVLHDLIRGDKNQRHAVPRSNRYGRKMAVCLRKWSLHQPLTSKEDISQWP
jgi:hypothetical protein